MDVTDQKPIVKGVYGCRTIAEVIKYISAINLKRDPVQFGVAKVAGVSMDRTRKEANAKAISLLEQLGNVDGATLTKEQRETLAAYTGEGGIGGTDSEYYTPQPIAEGIWEAMKLYGADSGNTLEPSSGVGVFHETKPKGVLMTATEIDQTSGRINQLLHPEDAVKISPFEVLASSAPDGAFDHCVGNVPFGDSRGDTAILDKAYAEESNMGRYFVLRLIDKIKAGGYACIIVPYGMTSGSTMRKLREQVSRKAEFLGAHRLPSGTFDENGTATVVDVLVLRKHPAELADFILQADEETLTATNVLWPEFITGKWFEQDGKRFIYGEQSQAFRGITVKNDQITNADLKQKLIHKFESRILWDQLNIDEPIAKKAAPGEKRFINGLWYEFDGSSWIIDNTVREMALDTNKYGASSHEDLDRLTSTHEGILTLSYAQISAINTDYPFKLNSDLKDVLSWVQSQKAPLRERLWRGSLIGQKVAQYRDMLGRTDADSIESIRIDTAKLVQGELSKYGNPNQGKISKASGKGSGDWMSFRGAIRNDSSLTDMLSGKLDVTGGELYDAHDHAATLRHLFNNIDLKPIELSDFRAAFKGELPENDNDLLDLLANVDGIAVAPDGELMPFDRATSGDIGMLNTQLQIAVSVMPEGRQKANMIRQIMAIRDKRTWTDGEDVNVKMNARWLDRSLLLDFLHENGYEDFKYVKDIQLEGGQLVSGDYQGPDGLFVGYRYGTVLGKNKKTGLVEPRWDKKSAKAGEGFNGQLEKYLNGGKPGGANADEYKQRIADMENQFNAWLKGRDDYDAAVVGRYNDVFNNYIPYTQSDADLQLKTISGLRVPMGYQAQEVRRVSEQGRGIIGFGTGLGKTTTGLALEAYNFENGRTKRTAIVVPKAVYQNWYYEAKEFYSPEAFANMLFVGLDPIVDSDGNIKQVPVLDESGKETGQYRDALKEADEATIKARMGSIPQSNWRMVIMTKEQYAKIPLKDETIRDHAYDTLFAAADAGRVALNTTNHKEETAKKRVLSKASDDGTQKEYDYPFFEDMNFDSVIADEGHNYRNSYSGGRESSSLAYLPNPAVAQSARDFSLKTAYLMDKNKGRGPVLLTATPLVNSPIDAYNMLSHVMPQEEWRRMGILTPDDFVKMFGRTESVLVQKVSGELVKKDGLVGFENLDALRAIFHRYTTLKTAKDVASTVKIPDLDERTQFAPMTNEQAETYEQLRQRADLIGRTDYTEEEIAKMESGEIPEKDSIFAIIRDMDRVCTDMDLYRRTLTFRFKPDQVAAVQQLADQMQPLAAQLGGDAVMTNEGEFISLVVPEDLEDQVMSALAGVGLQDRDVSHPIPPKYSKMIEMLKTGLADGKQIIFTDEKTQHGKLKRIICSALNIEPEKVSILNSDTVQAASKKPKIKKVNPPKELPDEPTEEQLQTFHEQKAAYDAYVGALEDVSLGGLEKISADFNEGRTPIIICNKKAEVGINLHKGTADIHHLTLPWTPASIDQRNGRGARVGSTHDRVRVHYYCGKGSFDQFRLDTLKRKKNWITEIITSDKSRMDNADANNAAEMQLLLAANPEERAKKMREQEESIKAKALAAAKVRANIDLQNYIKASHALTTDPQKAQKALDDAQSGATAAQSTFDQAVEDQKTATAEFDRVKSDPNMAAYQVNAAERTLKNKMETVTTAQKSLGKAKQLLRFQEGVMKRIGAASSKVKQLRPVVQKALDSGILEVDPDVLNDAKDMLLVDGRTFKVGQYYKADIFAKQTYGYSNRASNSNAIVRIERLDFDAKTATVSNVSSTNTTGIMNRSGVDLSGLGDQVDLTDAERDLLRKMSGGLRINQVPLLGISKAEFRQYLKNQQLFLDEIYFVCHDTDNAFKMQQIAKGNAPEFCKNNADIIVFPDASDRTLQTGIATFYRATPGYLQGNMHVFMSSLFGNNYAVAVDSYGEIASPETILTLVREWSDSFTPDSYTAKKGSMTGDSEQEVLAYIANGTMPYAVIDSMRPNAVKAPQYSNQKDILNAAASEQQRLRDVALANCKRAVAELGQNYYDQIKANVSGGVPENQAALEKFIAGTGPLRYAYRRSNYSTYLDVVPLFSDLIIAGLYDESRLTAAMLVALDVLNGEINQLESEVSQLSSDERSQRLDAFKLKTGAITQEQIDAKRAEQAKQEETAVETQTAKTETGIIVKTNAKELKVLYKRSLKARFDPGQAWALQDPDGLSGKLKKAKEDLKSQYDAVYYKGDDSDDEFPGSWWMIPKKYDINKILSTIANN